MRAYKCNACGMIHDTELDAAMCCPDITYIEVGPTEQDKLADWVGGVPIRGRDGKLEPGKAYRPDKGGYVEESKGA